MVTVADNGVTQQAELRLLMRDAGLEITPRRDAYLAQEGLTPGEAGELIGVSRQAIYKQIVAGRIPAEIVRIGGRDTWQIEPRVILQYALERKLEEDRLEEARQRKASGRREQVPEPEYLSPELKQRRRRILDRDE